METPSETSGSVFEHKARLYDFITRGVLAQEVVAALLPEGEPLAYERQLWDYKLELPQLPSGVKPSEDEKAVFNGAMCEVIKDAAAFYNSHGGYILVGVKNAPRELVGFTGQFDCDELNKRIVAVTGQSIECYFQTFPITDGNQNPVTLGLLFIPQRPDSKVPAQFIKDAVQKQSGKKAFSRNDIYLRIADHCIPATSSEHYTFLFTPGRRSIAVTPSRVLSHILDSNLGPRDPGFIEFVGREDYLSALWKWFLDRYNPVKLLAGIGGVGKTALAREFCEQVSRSAPFGFQKIVWLSAKRQFYTAINGKFVPTGRIDFDSVETLLKQICLELGLTEEEVSSDSARDQLIDAAISALHVIPALVVIDDIDSLEPEQQQDVFHTLISVFGQTVGKSPVGSRALLTARLDLGAAPGQVIRVKGLDIKEFVEFIDMTCTALELPALGSKSSKRIQRFHRVTEGSPTFASSILRLIALGESLDYALSKWEKSDGEEVRRFAFDRELEQLADSARNVLYALCCLSESSLLEMSSVLTRSEQQVRDDFAELRKYHLISHAEAHLPGGVRISIPTSIRMMREILKAKVRDPRRIEANCAKARSAESKHLHDIGPSVQRIITLWGNDHADDALILAEMLDRQYPSHPDVKCLLGRSYLRVTTPDFKKAELAFRKAQELGCARPELIPLWIEAKEELGDWNGVLDITSFSNNVPPAETLLARANAYKQLAEIDRKGGNVRSAADRYLEGGKEIDRVFKLKKASGAILELKQFRKEFMIAHVDLVNRLTVIDDDAIDVWLATVQSFDFYVRNSWMLRLGISKLRDWWRGVERREKTSPNTAATMDVQLTKLQKIKATLQGQDSPDHALISDIEYALNYLGTRRAAYIT